MIVIFKLWVPVCLKVWKMCTPCDVRIIPIAMMP